MSDDKDLPMDVSPDGEEIEIEFVDQDTDVTSVVDLERADEVTDDSPVQDSQDDLKAELEHVREMYLRKLAEFDNFRKRVDRERGEDRQAGAEDFVKDLLPVLDNFERALEHSEGDSGAFQQGVEMIAKQLWDTLEKRGVVEVNPVSEPFDPELHEAVQRVEDPELPSGSVAFVMLKGYKMGERLIRPALVGVAFDPGANGGDDGGGS